MTSSDRPDAFLIGFPIVQKLESFRDRMKKAESESLNLRRVLRSRGSGAEEASDEQPKPKDNGEEKEQPLDDPSSDEDAGEVKHSKESEEEESGEDAAPAPVPDPVIRTGEADWYSLASAAEKRIEEALQRSLDSARSSFTQEARRFTDAGIAGEPRPSQYLASIEERGDIIASNRQRHVCGVVVPLCFISLSASSCRIPFESVFSR